MSKQIKLGNTGFSFDVLQNKEQAEDHYSGVKKEKTIAGHKVEYTVLTLEQSTGPSFTWEWNDDMEIGHSVSDARLVEETLFKMINIGSNKRVPEVWGSHRLTSGVGLTWLTGTFTLDDDGEVTRGRAFYNDGSSANTDSPDNYPVFTFDSLHNLMEHLRQTLEDTCIIEIFNYTYLVRTTDEGEGSVEVISDLKPCDNAIHVLIQATQIYRAKFEITRNEKKHVMTTFLGYKSEDVEVARYPDFGWLGSADGNENPQVNLFIHNAEIYAYISDVEVNKSAQAALIKLEKSK